MCNIEFPHFGASYPDAHCIDGYLWDMDSYEDGCYTIGGDDPCPFCNTEAWLNTVLDNEEFASREEALAWVEKMREKWGAEHLADARKTLEIKPGDEVTINGHKIVYDKDKGYVTIVKSEELVPNDPNQAAVNWICSHKNGEVLYVKDAFIAGAKWDRSQMMQEAVEGHVWSDYMENYFCCLQINLGPIKGNEEIHDGDKVRVIVLPKED